MGGLFSAKPPKEESAPPAVTITAAEAVGSFADGLPATWRCTSATMDTFDAGINGNATSDLVSICFFAKGDPAHGTPPSFTATFDRGVWDAAQKKFAAVGERTPFDKDLMKIPCKGKYNSDLGDGTTEMTLVVRFKKVDFSEFFLDLEFKVNAGPHSSLNRTYHLMAVPQKQFLLAVTGKSVEEWVAIHNALNVHKGVGIHAEAEAEPEPEPDASAGAGSGAGGGAGAAADALVHDEGAGAGAGEAETEEIVVVRPVM